MLFTAFNRWLDEDWGFAYQDRIFAAPYLTLVDVDWAVQRAGVGARPGRPHHRDAPRRAHHGRTVNVPRPTEEFDPFWARVNEAGHHRRRPRRRQRLLVERLRPDGFTSDFKGGSMPQPVRMLQMERPIEDFLASLVADSLFHRFPNLRVASVENGSGFLRGLFHRLDALGHKMSGWFPEDPVETFRATSGSTRSGRTTSHEVLELMGPERVIFGSDWPHIEGMPRAARLPRGAGGARRRHIRKVVLDNTTELNELRPA